MLRRCLVTGSDSVGKSRLILTFADEYREDDTPIYVSDVHVKHTVEGVECGLELRKFGDMRDYPRMWPMFYGGFNLVLVCFSVVSPTSLKSAKEEWAKEANYFKKPFLLVGLKVDLRNDAATLEELALKGEKVISADKGRNEAWDLGAVKYVECSALTREGLKEVFDEVVLADLRVRPKSPDPHCGCFCLGKRITLWS